MFEKVFSKSRPKQVSEAMEYEDSKELFVRPSTPHRVYMKGSERKNLIKSYLSDREGEETSITDIAKVLKVSIAQASRLVADLISNGEVTRHGEVRHYTFTVNDAGIKKASNIIPEVQGVKSRKRADAKERVLSFLATHQDVLITQEEIARGSGMAQPRVSNILKELELMGTIVRSAPTYEGTKYWVNSSPNAHLEDTPEPVSSKNAPNAESELLMVIDTLVWGFIRETRTTDILAFLTWLEKGATLKR